jgi:hypothetical protein
MVLTAGPDQAPDDLNNTEVIAQLDGTSQSEAIKLMMQIADEFPQSTDNGARP